MTALALTRILRHVASLGAAARFYREALDFQQTAAPAEDPALAQVLAVRRVLVLRMKLGEQELALCETDPAVQPFPHKLAGNDLRFQHIAVVTTDMNAAYDRMRHCGIIPLSTAGPQILPPSSGGVTAYKFYDPEGHPLELLQFPGQKTGKKLFTGFDHSAITVSNPACSVAFYESIGLQKSSQQINHGSAQDALDALLDTKVDVLALTPKKPRPHVELLHYRQPSAAPVTWQPCDIRADRLVFATSEPGLRLARDPDGHEVVLEGSKQEVLF